MAEVEPYFETRLGRLYCGDALEVLKQLPDESADLIILDPPYVKIRDSRTRGKANWRVTVEHFERVLSESKRIIKRDQPVVLFGLPSFFVKLGRAIDENFRVYFDVVWEKPAPANPLVSQLHPLVVHEQILFLVRRDAKVSKMKYRPFRIGSYGNPPVLSGSTLGKRFNNMRKVRKAPPDFRYPRTVVRFNHLKKRHGHPTEKPVELMEWLIRGWTDENDLVVDPFAGSGSALVGAEKLNRRWVGVEINPDYCEIIRRRFERELGDVAKNHRLGQWL